MTIAVKDFIIVLLRYLEDTPFQTNRTHSIKIFNLFVCKIYDEDTHGAEDILDFQWKPGDDYSKLIVRLSELYQKGIGDYLQLPVESEYFSPYSEFAFVDIYNKDSQRINLVPND